MLPVKQVLFVCIENSCRSQMAEAFGRTLGAGAMEAYSSGSRPSGKVNEKAIAAMRAVGYDLTTHRSKSLDDIPQIEYDLVVTMGCGDECPYVRAKRREAWDIPDPKHMEMNQFHEVRDFIKKKVSNLVADIQTAITTGD